MKKKFFLLNTILFVISCNTKNDSINSATNASENEIQQSHTSTSVKITKPFFGDFNLELTTTGKVFAKKRNDLKFKLDLEIERINVGNGDKVIVGEIIAIQKSEIYRNKVIKAKEQLSRAKIDIEDILIGFNYSYQDTTSIPSNILEMAKNRSNYNTALSELELAKLELSSTKLKSPINGIVANLNAKVHSTPDSSKPLCTIIDNSVLEVEFSVLEEDFIFISKNQTIEISNFVNDDILDGYINRINPSVDENGMISITGVVNNTTQNIIDGMTVNITIKKVVENKLFIPRESVVYRDEKKVVFTYDKRGVAIWNYVETSYENNDFVVIEKGIVKGDDVIYLGNENLAHKSSVLIEDE